MKQAKQILAFLLAAAMAVLSASCGAERPQPSESGQTQITTTADGAGAGKTTAAGEPSAAPTDDRETANGTQPTQPDDVPSVPPATPKSSGSSVMTPSFMIRWVDSLLIGSVLSRMICSAA